MNAYQIGVSIVLANGVSPVLAIIGSDLLKLHTSANQIQQNFTGWGTALVGVGAILAGSTILGALGSIVNKTKEFQDELIKVQRLGGDMGQLAADGSLTKQAFKIADKIPMKVEDLLKIPADMYSVLGTEHALEVWEPLAEYAWIAKRSRGEKGGGSKTDIVDLIRAGEMTGRIYDSEGHIDPAKLKEFISDVTKVTAATHGTVNPQSILALAQQGGPALRGLTHHGFESLLVQSQMMGGHRAGTAYLSLWQQMAGGQMTERTAQNLQQFGLLKEGEWYASHGHAILGDTAKHRLMTEIGKDPLTLAKSINEELKRRGITDPAEQFQAVMGLTGRQTTQRFTAEEVIAYNQMMAEIERLDKGLGTGESKALYDRKSITGAEENLSNSWHNLIIAIGGPEGERFATFLNKIADGVKFVTDKVNSLDPKTIDTIFEVTAGLAAGLVTIGGVLLVALGTMTIGALVGSATLIGGAIAAVVAAAATFAAFHWDDIKNAFNGIYNSVAGFVEKIKGLYHAIGGWFSSTAHGSGWGPERDERGHIKNPGLFDKFIWGEPDDKVAKPGGSPGGNLAPWTSVTPQGSSTPPTLKPGIQLQNWNPGIERNKPSQISLSLQIDGRTLAQAISDELEALLGFPTGAPSPDGIGRWFDGDHQTVTT